MSWMGGPATATALLSTSNGSNIIAHCSLLNAVMLHPGSAACTLTVYDLAVSSTTGGTVICQLQGTANGATVLFPFDGAPPRALNGLTYYLTGTASQAQIYYQPEF